MLSGVKQFDYRMENIRVVRKFLMSLNPVTLMMAKEEIAEGRQTKTMVETAMEGLQTIMMVETAMED